MEDSDINEKFRKMNSKIELLFELLKAQDQTIKILTDKLLTH